MVLIYTSREGHNDNCENQTGEIYKFQFLGIVGHWGKNSY